jgi:hypothetical protein
MFSSVKLYKQSKDKEKFVIVYYQHETILRHRVGITVKERDFDARASMVKATDKKSLTK